MDVQQLGGVGGCSCHTLSHFQQLLRSLADEHRRLERERDALSEEVSGLLQRLGQPGLDQTGRCPSDAAAPRRGVACRPRVVSPAPPPAGRWSSPRRPPDAGDGEGEGSGGGRPAPPSAGDAAQFPGQVVSPRAAPRGADGDGGAADQDAPASGGLLELEAKRRTSQGSGGDAPARAESDWLDEKEQMNRARQKARFLEVFNLKKAQLHTFTVTKKSLGQVLAKRGLQNVKESFLEEALKELARVSPAIVGRGSHGPPSSTSFLPLRTRSVLDSPRADAGIGFEAFVNAVLMPDLPKRVEPRLSRGIEKMQEALLKQDVEEVIAKLTRLRESIILDVPLDGDAKKAPKWKPRVDTALAVVVTLTVLVSIFCLGLSQEIDPDWGGWLALEALFALIFVAEIVLKILMHGSRSFWCGAKRKWNWLDAAVTVTSVGDVLLNLAVRNLADVYKFSRFTLVLRAFRLMRLGRVLMTMSSPWVRELSNMLIGFVLGSPALLWVTMIIWVVVALLAMSLRIVIGPRPGQDVLIEKCGSGDRPFVTVETDPDCAKHKLYAEEYCGSMSKCMFTVFRCIIGDCTSSGGQSLAGHMSEGFGTQFDVVYLTGMIVMMFGLFNVITAIFVEATMAGLKYSEAKQKLRSVYEHQYVNRKLKTLVTRIKYVYRKLQQGERDRRQSDGKAADDLVQYAMHRASAVSSMSDDPDSTDNINLTEKEFFSVIEDSGVGRILMELDIKIEGVGKEALFDLVDTNESGTVDVACMIENLMKLRGGPMKIDMIAPSVALRGLQQELRRLSSRLAGPPDHSWSLGSGLACPAPADPAVRGGDPGASPRALAALGA